MSEIIFNWDIKQDVKDLIKQKTEKYCDNKYKNDIPGNTTFKKIILENLKLKLYIQVFDLMDALLFNGMIPAKIGNTKEEKLKTINEMIDKYLTTGRL